ncbi:MAG: autotransporter outer membrane beta-barrel domain-containing protein [Helicobacter sp.]|nr:autotransporter outer membrane beta-barrel domain-containing protein [Helicobacter sp.]
MAKTRLSVVTCRVLLGMSLALGAQGLYAANDTVSVDGEDRPGTTVSGQFKQTQSGSFSTRKTTNNRASGDYTYNDAQNTTKVGQGETADFTFNYSTQDFFGGNAGDGVYFNKTTEKVNIDAGEGNINLSDGTTTTTNTATKITRTDKSTFTTGGFAESVDGLYNFTLKGKNVNVDGFELVSFDGKSTIEGDTFLFNGASLTNGFTQDYAVSYVENGGAQNGIDAFIFRNSNLFSNNASVEINGNLDLTQNSAGVAATSGSSLNFNGHLLNNSRATITVNADAETANGGAYLGTIGSTAATDNSIGIASNGKILSFNKAKLLTVTGGKDGKAFLTYDNALEFINGEDSSNGVWITQWANSVDHQGIDAVMSIDYKAYFNDIINDLNGIKNTQGFINANPTSRTTDGITAIAGASTQFAGEEVKYERSQALLDLIANNLATYRLSTDETVDGSRKNNAKNLYISGGATVAAGDVRTKALVTKALLEAYATDIANWAAANGITITNSFYNTGTAITNNNANDARNNVEQALDKLNDAIVELGALTNTGYANVDGYSSGAIRNGATFTANTFNGHTTYANGTAVTFDNVVNNGLFRLDNYIYVTRFDKDGKVLVDRDSDGVVKAGAKYNAYQLVSGRQAYDAIKASNVEGLDKTALNYTRNDIFAQNSVRGKSVTGINIDAGNQQIVARYLDGLQTKIQGRVSNTAAAGDDKRYSAKDLHTQDTGSFVETNDGGRTAAKVDRDGNVMQDKNGDTIYVDNSAVLDRLALMMYQDGVANNVANQYRESAKSISNTNTAMSSVNSIINITNDLSLTSRIAMRDNPYNSYAYQMRGVELAAVASDMGPNYVDTYSTGIWANAFGGANVIDGNSGGVYGVSVGFDVKASDNVLWGLYFTYADADIKDNLVKQESDNFQIGAYSSIQLAPLWELNLKLFGQFSPSDQYRYDALGSYDSDFTRKSFGAGANVGRAFKYQEDTLVLKPFVGLNYYYTNTPSYSESGLGFDHVNSTTNNTVALDLGVEFRKYTSLNSYIFITPKIEQYLINNGDDFRATMGGIAMPTVDGADKNKTYGQIIIGGNFDITEDFSANVGVGAKQIFAGKVDGKDETYISGQAGIKYKF